MEILMVGHSTILIETHDQKILTDPYFGIEGNRLYERLAPPAIAREAIGDVHLVLLSHNHWDHVDPRFFRSLAPTVPIFTSKYAAWLTKRQGAKHVVGLKMWETQSFGELRITAVPAIHDAIAIGFILESEGRQLYFSGDTFYGSFMKHIGQRWQLNVALMPVTTTRLPMAMDQQQAVWATKALSPKVVIPIHLGIRPRFAFLRTNHTPEGFEKQLREAKPETR